MSPRAFNLKGWVWGGDALMNVSVPSCGCACALLACTSAPIHFALFSALA